MAEQQSGNNLGQIDIGGTSFFRQLQGIAARQYGHGKQGQYQSEKHHADSDHLRRIQRGARSRTEHRYLQRQNHG